MPKKIGNVLLHIFVEIPLMLIDHDRKHVLRKEVFQPTQRFLRTYYRRSKQRLNNIFLDIVAVGFLLFAFAVTLTFDFLSLLESLTRQAFELTEPIEIRYPHI